MRPRCIGLPHRPALRTACPSRRARPVSAILACLSTALCLASPLAHAADDEAAPPDTPVSAHAAPAAAVSTPSGASAAVAASTALPAPNETSKVTEHTIGIDGHRIAYRATAGTLLIRDAKGEPDASMFYVAYTARGGNAAHRPVTFLFNGGPGASSIFLLIGSLGPKRVHTQSPAPTPAAPYPLADNPDSLLDKSDLVFIDAVGTGFSRPIGHGSGKAFYGVDGDLDAFVRFIDRYLTVNQRWNSPKFLMGESYGATRAAMLAYRLGQHQIAVNGVVLLSSVLNANVHAPGYDLASVRYLPSYAAVAWYHGKIRDTGTADLPAFLDEVRAFAAGPYSAALAKGDSLPDSERDAVAAQLAHYTGLDVQYVIAAHLRVRPSQFRQVLLRDGARSVGRYDGRFKGIEADSTLDSPDFDPSEKYIVSAFDAAFHEHLARDLNYQSPLPYLVFNSKVLSAWNSKHRMWWGETLQVPYAAGDLAEAMRQDPGLRVLSANGYFDLATPFFSTEYDLAHLGLEPSLRSHIEITHYASGHMIYLDDAALHELKRDLARFYDTATRRDARR